MDQWFLDRAREGKVYRANNTTTGEVTVLSSTCTGLVLENPYGSKKQLVVARMSANGTALTTIRELGVAVSSAVSTTISTSTTAAVIHNGRVNGSNGTLGVGRVWSIATLPSEPLWLRPLGSARVTTAVEGSITLEQDFDGTLIVMPGTYVCFSSLTTAGDAMCSITWAEVDE